MTDHSVDVRVRRAAKGLARAYSRAQAFDIGSQVGLRDSEEQPSAVEYALGALGGDLVCGLERAAEGEGVPLHAIEITMNGRLDNVLTHLGVVGEHGHPGLASIEGTAYVGSDADEADVQRAWRRALARSPLYNTFTRAATVTIALKVVR